MQTAIDMSQRVCVCVCTQCEIFAATPIVQGYYVTQVPLQMRLMDINPTMLFFSSVSSARTIFLLNLVMDSNGLSAILHLTEHISVNF